MLGFAWLKEGDVQLSPQGVRFADADIQARKVLFREAALEHVTILKQIDSILKRKSDHSITDEFFHDILDEHFSEDEVQRQFDTATNWGRYAEIFDYDRESGRLVQTEAPQTDAVRSTADRPTPTSRQRESGFDSHTESLIESFLREKPAHEEEHHAARILGIPPVVATAADRSLAPARCHHVRRGDRAVLWRGYGRALLVRTIYSDGGNFAQPAGVAGLCRIFAVAHHDRLRA